MREPKKTETIEIRLDHETKAALQAKARGEARSVSEVLRMLIARYIGAGAPSEPWGKERMQYFSLAALGVVLVAGFLVMSPARASDISVGVTTRLETGANDLPDLSEPEARFKVVYGEPIVLCIPRDAPDRATRALAGAACSFGPAGGFRYAIWVDPAADGQIRVSSQLLRPEAPLTVSINQRDVAHLHLGEVIESLSFFDGMQEAVRVAVFVDQP